MHDTCFTYAIWLDAYEIHTLSTLGDIFLDWMFRLQHAAVAMQVSWQAWWSYESCMWCSEDMLTSNWYGRTQKTSMRTGRPRYSSVTCDWVGHTPDIHGRTYHCIMRYSLHISRHRRVRLTNLLSKGSFFETPCPHVSRSHKINDAKRVCWKVGPWNEQCESLGCTV